MVLWKFVAPVKGDARDPNSLDINYLVIQEFNYILKLFSQFKISISQAHPVCRCHSEGLEAQSIHTSV